MELCRRVGNGRGNGPQAMAQVHGERRCDWRAFDRRADGIAARLLEAGLARHDKVALYLYNTPEYLETAFGAMKAALVPVNTNYRYKHDELLYLWDNADAAAVVFDGAFAETVDGLRARCPKVKLWLHVGAGFNTDSPSWAASYEQAATAVAPRCRPPWGRSGDDPIFIYTGGTTGRPKGVMWRQHDLYMASNVTNDPQQADLAFVRERVAASPQRPVGLPAPPLMHGTAYVFASTVLNRGGTVVTLPEQRFDAGRLLEAIVTHGVTDTCIVGDAFCRPMVDALDAAPGRYDLSKLRAMSSSGMMWSPDVKARLLAHAPQLVMIDFLNSSEASGMGRSITSKRGGAKGARFELGKNAFVIDDDGEPIRAGQRQGRTRRRARHRASRLLQGSGEDQGHVPRHRRRALRGAGRLRDRRGGRQHHASRPRIGQHQHRRREGVSGRGRRGDQDLCGSGRRGRRGRAGPAAGAGRGSARRGHGARRRRDQGARARASSPATRSRAT